VISYKVHLAIFSFVLYLVERFEMLALLDGCRVCVCVRDSEEA